MTDLPVQCLREFAASLGWPGLQEFTHTRSRVLIRWYEAGSVDNILLQINEKPLLCAAVYAVPYRICTGWHAIQLHESDLGVDREATRLGQWLHRKWFDTPAGREVFSRRHPECVGYGEAEIARGELPYSLENPRSTLDT